MSAQQHQQSTQQSPQPVVSEPAQSAVSDTLGNAARVEEAGLDEPQTCLDPWAGPDAVMMLECYPKDEAVSLALLHVDNNEHIKEWLERLSPADVLRDVRDMRSEVLDLFWRTGTGFRGEIAGEMGVGEGVEVGAGTEHGMAVSRTERGIGVEMRGKYKTGMSHDLPGVSVKGAFGDKLVGGGFSADEELSLESAGKGELADPINEVLAEVMTPANMLQIIENGPGTWVQEAFPAIVAQLDLPSLDWTVTAQVLSKFDASAAMHPGLPAPLSFLTGHVPFLSMPLSPRMNGALSAMCSLGARLDLQVDDLAARITFENELEGALSTLSQWAVWPFAELPMGEWKLGSDLELAFTLDLLTEDEGLVGSDVVLRVGLDEDDPSGARSGKTEYRMGETGSFAQLWETAVGGAAAPELDFDELLSLTSASHTEQYELDIDGSHIAREFPLFGGLLTAGEEFLPDHGVIAGDSRAHLTGTVNVTAEHLARLKGNGLELPEGQPLSRIPEVIEALLDARKGLPTRESWLAPLQEELFAASSDLTMSDMRLKGALRFGAGGSGGGAVVSGAGQGTASAFVDQALSPDKTAMFEAHFFDQTSLQPTKGRG